MILFDHLLSVDDEDSFAGVVDTDTLKVVDDVIAIGGLHGLDAGSGGAVNVCGGSETTHPVGRADGQLVNSGIDINLEGTIG